MKWISSKKLSSISFCVRRGTTLKECNLVRVRIWFRTDKFLFWNELIFAKYVLRLTELSKKSDDEVNNVENLSSLVKQLNNLPDQDSRGISSKEIYSEYQMILKEIESAQKSSVLNKARLDYLQVLYYFTQLSHNTFAFKLLYL